MNLGSSNRQIYDNCSYGKELYESTSPYYYRVYFGNYENCNKCKYDKFYVKFQPEIVNIESELKNLTRPLSNCDQFKYSPNCKDPNICISTFDKSAPVVFAPEVCPIVHNNIPKTSNPGRRFPDTNICNIGKL